MQNEAVALEQLAGLLHITSRYAEQLEMADRAAELYRQLNDLEGEGRVIARTARVYFLLGRRREGIDRLQELVRRFEGRPASPAHFALYENLVTLTRKSGMQRECEEASERALRMAQELGDDHTLARAWGRRALALSRVEGLEAEAERAHLEAVRLAEAAGDLDTLYLALNNVGVLYWDSGDRERARQYDERKLGIARRLGNPWGVAVALVDLSDQRYEQGDLARWRSLREEVVQLAQSTGLTVLSGWLAIPGEFLMADGAAEEARAHFECCLADGDHSGDEGLVSAARWDIAELNRLEGYLDSARQTYETLLQTPDLDADARYPLLLPLLATLLEMRTDDGTRAARRILEQERSADRLHLQVRFLARVHAVSGWLAAREGSRSEALRLMEASLGAFRSHGMVVNEGEVLVYYGLMLAELGEIVTARERLAEALEIFRRIGHVMHTRRAERFLAQVDSLRLEPR